MPTTPARDAVLATVAHDLKDPLGTIVLAAGLLLDELEPGTDAPHAQRNAQRCQLQTITRAADRMRRLVDDLLDANALAAGRLRVNLAPHAAAELLEDARAVLAPGAVAKGITLAVEVGASLPDVRADRGRLLQVFANVGGNAVKFTPPGGRVTLRAALRAAPAGTARDLIEFAVADTGIGIAAGDLRRVFDRFWQARDTARLGTGLGLAIARGLVEAHGGRLRARSVPGAGSTFAFTLPTVRRGTRPAAVPRSA